MLFTYDTIMPDDYLKQLISCVTEPEKGPKKYTKSDLRLIFQLKGEGKSLAQIAARLGCCRTYVSYVYRGMRRTNDVIELIEEAE